jgi:hypothetical protein
VTWFSDVVQVDTLAGAAHAVVVDLKPGATVHGELDSTVPRPVTNGRVIANVWPQAHKPQDSPPQWHAWSTVRDDGSFQVGFLPPGDLEVVVLCDGFVSTNGPGQSRMRYPQKHVLGSSDLAITIGMEPTARLEVRVTDDQGKPLKDAHVSTWPNVRYGEWWATILASDCYNTADGLKAGPEAKAMGWFRSAPPDFEGTSDGLGLAVLPNLPPEVYSLSVEHPDFVLPAVVAPGGEKNREARVTLVPGRTNHAAVRLERREQAPISHY